MRKINFFLTFLLVVGLFLFLKGRDVKAFDCTNVSCQTGFHCSELWSGGYPNANSGKCIRNGSNPVVTGCHNDTECPTGFSCTDKVNVGYGELKGTCTNIDPMVTIPNGQIPHGTVYPNAPSATPTLLTQAATSTPPPAAGQIFSDVPPSHYAFTYIETLYRANISTGCGVSPLRFCPEENITRAQIAVFLLKAKHGSTYTPPPVGSTTSFGDVPITHWAAAWIKEFVIEGNSAGCSAGNFCPDDPVTRAQAAVFLLRSKNGSDYSPPAVGSSSGFTDVPITHFAAAFIKEIATEGITAGCGAGIFCPDSPITRAQAAVFIVRMFNITAVSTSPTLTPPINPNCVCSTDVCSSDCTFDKFSDVTYASSIKCSQDANVFASTPSTDDKNGWCQATLRTKGDVDGHDGITMADYYYYLAAVVGGKMPVWADADVDGDGQISTLDRAIIMKSLQTPIQ
ncbi:MAG: S-layer homology domain-containing protein [Patescibacteria group bacterium]|jgi:hypothetical protein